MTVQELEKALRRRSLRRRLIMGALFLVFLAAAVVFTRLWENSKEVTQIGNYTSVRYDERYMPPMIVSTVMAVLMPFVLLRDILCCRLATVDTGGGHSLTVYRGWFEGTVYVDGTAKAATWRSRRGAQSVEVWLPDGGKAVVSFANSLLYLAQIFYSDGSPSVEV